MFAPLVPLVAGGGGAIGWGWGSAAVGTVAVAAVVSIPGDTTSDRSRTVPSSDSGSKACPPRPGNQDPCKGLRDQLAAHEQKYREYVANPSASDNLGVLSAAYNAGDMTRYTNIINGRLRNLGKQIADFRKQLQECERVHGKR